MVRQSHHSEAGVALISVLAITAIVLIIISVVTLVSIINAKLGLDKVQSQKSYQGAEGLIDEAILRFVRYRSFTNPYPEWTENCLQIEGFECKMELDLDQNGGTIDAWGKMADKIRHLQVKLVVAEDGSASISGRKEIY